jgi:hypothetical protein
MANDRRVPWLKFYSSDWRADPGLRMCSYAARGLWVDMLTLMHEAEPYGHLVVSGSAPDARDIAALLGGTEKEIGSLLSMLESKRVFSRTPEGTIYSRRMVRDAEQAERDRANGKRGGNPSVKPATQPDHNHPVERGVNPPNNPDTNHEVNGWDKAQKPEAISQKERGGERTPGSARERTPRTGPMPTLADPPSRWFGIADKTEIDDDGIERPVVGGYYLDEVARMVCEAACINGAARPVDWSPLTGWLREGFDPHERIIPVVRRLAARSGYTPPKFLSYFDDAIREGRAA